MADQEKIEVLTESVQKYIKTNIEIVKLEVVESASGVLTSLINALIVSFAFLLFIFFLSLSAAYYISNYFNSIYIGFVIVAAFYLILVIVFLIIRKSVLVNLFRNKIIQTFYNEK